MLTGDSFHVSPNLLNVAEYLWTLKPMVRGTQSIKRLRRNKREIRVSMEEGGGNAASPDSTIYEKRFPHP